MLSNGPSYPNGFRIKHELYSNTCEKDANYCRKRLYEKVLTPLFKSPTILTQADVL